MTQDSPVVSFVVNEYQKVFLETIKSDTFQFDEGFVAVSYKDIEEFSRAIKRNYDELSQNIINDYVANMHQSVSIFIDRVELVRQEISKASKVQTGKQAFLDSKKQSEQSGKDERTTLVTSKRNK